MSDQYPGDDELGRLLSVIDEPVDEVPPAFADALWSELRAGLRDRVADRADRADRERTPGTVEEAEPTDRAGADEGDDSVDGPHVVDVRASGPGSNRADGTERAPRRWLAITAAAAVVLLAVGLYLGGDDGTDITTPPDVTADRATAPPDAGPPVLTDPVAACERYLGTEPTLVQLIDRLDAGPPPVPADLDAAIGAIETLVADLSASGRYLDRQYASLDLAVASLGQARIELVTGDRERALESVETALYQLTSVDLPGITPFRDVCVPLGS
jgi:hypothetical protein